MDALFTTLISKTFIILTTQLFITFLGSVLTLQYFKGLYKKGHPGVSATHNKYGELDLEIDPHIIAPYKWPLLIGNIAVFLALLFIGINNLSIGIPLFTIWSVLTGIEIGIVLISIDENLAQRVLAITVSITCATALIGMYSGIDFSGLGIILIVLLLCLIVANIIRLFIKMDRWKERIIAGIGVSIFIGFLLYDFFRLEQAKEIANNWHAAMSFAIEIYLDIINLFLYLLDLMNN